VLHFGHRARRIGMHRLLSRLVLGFVFLSASGLAWAQQAPQIQQLVFTPYRASGIYDVGDTVGWKVSPGPATVTHGYKWTILANNAVVLKQGRLNLSGNDKIEIVADQPGMIYVAVEAAQSLSSAARVANPPAAGGNAGRDTGFYAVGAAVAPAKIGLSTP